jgi:hypothetical protein
MARSEAELMAQLDRIAARYRKVMAELVTMREQARKRDK